MSEPLAETIEYESVSFPGRLWDPFLPDISEGEPVTIAGHLTVPATDRPVPAVVIAHGCGGLGGAEWGWVDVLAEAGVAAFLVDSFGARGITNICGGTETINVASPIVDVYRAAEALDAHPYVDGSRLAVMGFSFGGRTAIWAEFARFQEAYEGHPFVGYIAFYPSTCFIELEDEGEVVGGPLRIFHGTADDYTPIDQCHRMVDRMSALGVDAEINEYPGAPHSFDNVMLGWSPIHMSLWALSPRGCEFMEQEGAIIDPETGQAAGVGSTCVERGVTYGYDEEAREQAEDDLLELLGRLFNEE
ncbi:MAG: dienelactone hydrolase family protein [Acidimicrobiia bacterium]|nr:dienelactone hydrolase family protein [Acidimicrobiia bacterium]